MREVSNMEKQTRKQKNPTKRKPKQNTKPNKTKQTKKKTQQKGRALYLISMPDWGAAGAEVWCFTQQRQLPLIPSYVTIHAWGLKVICTALCFSDAFGWRSALLQQMAVLPVLCAHGCTLAPHSHSSRSQVVRQKGCVNQSWWRRESHAVRAVRLQECYWAKLK